MIMVTEHGTMHTEVVFNTTKSERFLLKKVWNSSLPIVSLIMCNPSLADTVCVDMTSHYAICNLFKLGYGGMEITNITSTISTKLSTKDGIFMSDENVDFILKSAEVCEKVILAWGKCGEGNKKIQAVQIELLEKLKPFEDKLFEIASDKGESGFHPLAPQIRHFWSILKFTRPEYLQVKKEDEPKEGDESAPDKASETTSDETSTGEPEKASKERKSKKGA